MNKEILKKANILDHRINVLQSALADIINSEPYSPTITMPIIRNISLPLYNEFLKKCEEDLKFQIQNLEKELESL